jgi:hypothetical protein
LTQFDTLADGRTFKMFNVIDEIPSTIGEDLQRKPGDFADPDDRLR